MDKVQKTDSPVETNAFESLPKYAFAYYISALQAGLEAVTAGEKVGSQGKMRGVSYTLRVGRETCRTNQ
jgi:hypothetical protein